MAPRRTRMYLLDHPTPNLFTMVGETSHIYEVRVTNAGTACTCPAAIFSKKKGKRCKHQMYVLQRVLRQPDVSEMLGPLEDAETWLQNLQLSDDVVDEALVKRFNEVLEKNKNGESVPDADKGKRKVDEDVCSICYDDIEADGTDSIVYCDVQCGTPFHQACISRWMTVKNKSTATCPYCRTPWPSSSVTKAAEKPHPRGKGTKPHTDPLTGKLSYLRI